MISGDLAAWWSWEERLEEDAQKPPQPAPEEGEVVAGGSEEGVAAVAATVLEVIAAHAVLGLEVADDGLDRSAALHLAADRAGTDAVLEEVTAWQACPLEATYPLVFFDALRVKIRDEGLVRNKAVHIALGVRADGTKEILGLWLEQNEGAKFWLRVMNELKNRGVEDVLIAVVAGLKGFPEAITAVFPGWRSRRGAVPQTKPTNPAPVSPPQSDASPLRTTADASADPPFA